MNEYGTLARTHWQRWLPSRYAAMSEADRESFFTALGEQVAQRVADLQESLESGLDRPAMDFRETVGRLTAIRLQAREIALREMVYVEPETTEPALDANDQPFDPDAPILDPLAEWMDAEGMPRDRSHPLWRMLEDDSVSESQFAAAARAWEASLWERIDTRRP